MFFITLADEKVFYEIVNCFNEKPFFTALGKRLVCVGENKEKEKWLYIYNNSFYEIFVYILNIFYIS